MLPWRSSKHFDIDSRHALWVALILLNAFGFVTKVVSVHALKAFQSWAALFFLAPIKLSGANQGLVESNPSCGWDAGGRKIHKTICFHMWNREPGCLSALGATGQPKEHFGRDLAILEDTLLASNFSGHDFCRNSVGYRGEAIHHLGFTVSYCISAHFRLPKPSMDVFNGRFCQRNGVLAVCSKVMLTTCLAESHRCISILNERMSKSTKVLTKDSMLSR